jgi:hypothetical protein
MDAASTEERSVSEMGHELRRYKERNMGLLLSVKIGFARLASRRPFDAR